MLPTARRFTVPLVSKTVNTFIPGKLRRKDWIETSAQARLTLVLRNVHPRYYSGEPIQGFLYYHVPYPAQSLSGSLRFRCMPNRNPNTFHAGSDLSDHHLISQDKLLTEEQLCTAKNLLRYNPQRDNQLSIPVHVHRIGQPFAPVYPAILLRGGAIVCLERVGEDEALQLRILEPPHDFHERILRGYGELRRLPDPVLEDYLPKFRHLPPLRAGDLLPDPASKRAEPFNDAIPNRDAALYCLLHPVPAPARGRTCECELDGLERARDLHDSRFPSRLRAPLIPLRHRARLPPEKAQGRAQKRMRSVCGGGGNSSTRRERVGVKAEPPAPEPALGTSKSDTRASSTSLPSALTPAASGWGSFLEGAADPAPRLRSPG
ncbi:hypothetical protein B0H14DRAFT_3896758 [Mycena olivaceomarginata]|nr:hypothetical protein B0H14DRAFT_3896758 [Mycena olivaceomarginata]